MVKRMERMLTCVCTVGISDIVDHAFEQKIKDFLKYLKEKKIFGHITVVQLFNWKKVNPDYRELGEQDQYESAGLDASFEDGRDLDQIIRDRQAAEMELDNRDGVASQRKFPQLLRLILKCILSFVTLYCFC